MRLNPAALSSLRVLSGLSQAELGRRSGVSQGHISELERGDKHASPRTAKKLADAMGVPMASLLSGGPGTAEAAS